LVLALGILFGTVAPAHALYYCNNTLIGGLLDGYIGLSTTSMAFGAYNPGQTTATTANATITLACTGSLLGALGPSYLPPYTMSLSAGGGSFAQRLMTTGTTTLKYQIYTSSGYGTVWGDGSGTTSTVAGGNDGNASETLTAYGSIPAGQFVKPGSYTDTITVTVTY
jgi:spore coat protein U-like protein